MEAWSLDRPGSIREIQKRLPVVSNNVPIRRYSDSRVVLGACFDESRVVRLKH